VTREPIMPSDRSTDVKFFTVAEANRTLPLVRRIVADVVAEHPRWRRLMADYEVAALSARPDAGESATQLRLRAEIDVVARRIDGYVRELRSVGCRLKSYENGTVDFHARHHDRVVLLCWRLGEEAVAHWHELDVGFGGRQVITAEFAAEPVGQTP
jgi:hypothetical protein